MPWVRVEMPLTNSATPVWVTVGSSALPCARMAVVTIGALLAPPDPNRVPVPTMRLRKEIE